MAIDPDEVSKLCSRLRLGEGHEAQESAVRSALTSLLSRGQRGVVLADEVGFGKTYEALSIMALLCDHARASRKAFDRVLILCKSSLLEKWREELSTTHPERGFPQYLIGDAWPARHPIFRLLGSVHVVGRRASADEHQAVRDGGRLQAAPGIYIVNQTVLTQVNRNTRWFLRRLFETEWDLVIVDEAHHYARWTKPAYIFAPNGRMTDYNQGLSGGKFGKILALTATPFELTPHEMVQLFALVRAEPEHLDLTKKALDLYVRRLEIFFSLRQRSVTDPLRREAVKALNILRDKDALAGNLAGTGLEALLRRYMIRNVKSQNERRYFLVNRAAGTFTMQPFQKLDDLQSTLKAAALLPFEGPDALYYLELRALIDEKNERARTGEDQRTFVTMDLRQGLSSYPQLSQSQLLNGDFESARHLRHLINSWTKGRSQRLHPKVLALSDLVELIAVAEIAKISKDPDRWLSKVLVFNKLIGGTAPHLRDVLTKRLTPIFAKYLDEVLRDSGFSARAQFASKVRASLNNSLARAKAELETLLSGSLCLVPPDFEHENFRPYIGRSLVEAYRTTILRRTEQLLFLLRAARGISQATEEAIDQWLWTTISEPLVQTLCRVIQNSFDDEVHEERPRYERIFMAERECLVLMEECSSVGIVGRYDGSNVLDREAHRRNFNQQFNPFVLLVSRVGEEGIDLQHQCRYVIHYDLEWNPARMEQREGRVDRVGWGPSDEGFIDVRFMLLKGTYEERIFHAVMQRDQWFQVLIGSKRNELGRPLGDDAASIGHDIDDGPIDTTEELGRLSPDEKAAIMIDLRP